MNKWIGMGRLVRDPEVRYTQGQDAKAISRFTIACDRKFKKENEPSADFISCVAFGKVAEFIEKYVKKGTKVVVEGRWQTGSYEDREGKKVYTNDCFVESCEFAESKKESENAAPTPPPTPSNVGDGFMNIPDNISDTELPFV